ncbi:MAG: type II toxin-antitoxin system death-on-curing family toxin [Minisyncoccia bacterium]
MARRRTIKIITLVQIENVAHSLAQELMSWDEPIPAFNTRFPDRLESCLKTPFQKFGQRALYRGLVGKGAILFYLIIKNHPFQNGNKRVAVMTLLYFLSRNDWWLSVSPETLYVFAIEVAESDPKDREKMMIKIRNFIRRYLERI